MSRNPAFLKSRNKSIQREFEKKASEKIGSERLYRSQAILVMLSEKYFLAPSTLEDIINEQRDAKIK